MTPGRTPLCLVIGNDQTLARSLRPVLPDVLVRQVWTAPESEGLNVDVVVVGGDFPLQELDEVRVHPRLSGAPAVLVAPGRTVDLRSLHGPDTRVVLETDHVPERVAQAVREALTRPGPPDPPPSRSGLDLLETSALSSA